MSTDSVERSLDEMSPVVAGFVPQQPGRSASFVLRSGAGGHYDTFAKRALDVSGSVVLLLVLSPVMAAVALATVLSLGNPVLFRQERVGRHGRTFTVLKFRTMLQDRRESEMRASWDGTCRRRTHKSEFDPRHTRVGRALRRTSLDELPQLWNVLVGDMSLVGPRPELVSVVEHYSGWQHRRHAVRPGLTGLWQISARGDTPMHEATHIDLVYVRDMGLRSDLRILFRTPFALLRRGGS